MRILLLGCPLFRKELAELGHEIIYAASTADSDISLPPGSFSLADLAGHPLLGSAPDVCLFVENLGRRVFPSGIEDSPWPLVYYSIDTHLNYFWLKEFSAVCDLTLTTQLDFAARLSGEGHPSRWLPWSVDPAEYRDLALGRDLDIVFVGRVDEHRRRRENLLRFAGKKFPVSIFTPPEGTALSHDEISAIFSRAKIVLNEAIGGEVNFRVFEAMSCGALLLTERIGNGLHSMFRDEVELVSFTPCDLMDKLRFFLQHDEKRKQIAMAGKEKVITSHTRHRRAAELADILAGCGKRPRPAGRLASLARCYFFMQRRRLISDADGTAACIENIINRGLATPAEEHSCLHAAAEISEEAGNAEQAGNLRQIALAKGHRGIPLLSQSLLRFLKAGQLEEASVMCTELSRLASVTAPAEIAASVAAGTHGPELYLWLAEIAEQGTDRFVSGFFGYVDEPVPVTGPDYLKEGIAAGFRDVGICEKLGDIYLQAGACLSAAENYCGIINDPSMDIDAAHGARLRHKISMALASAFEMERAVFFAEAACELEPEDDYVAHLARLRKAVQ